MSRKRKGRSFRKSSRKRGGGYGSTKQIRGGRRI